jgi:glycosyltransferase involved in cell wall biosynthesis
LHICCWLVVRRQPGANLDLLDSEAVKICLLATTFPRHRGDVIPPFVLGLSRALVRAGASVSVLAPHDARTVDHDAWEGVDVHRFHYWWPQRAHGLCYGSGIPSNVRRRPWVAVQLPSLIAAFARTAVRHGGDADLYDAHWTFAGLAALLASRRTGKPLVTHAYSAEFAPAVLRPINRRIVASSASIICNSRFTEEIVRRQTEPRKTHVIASGVEPEKIASPDLDVQAFRAENGIPKDALFVFAISRHVRRKGYHTLLDAVASFRKSGRAIHLILGGDGPERAALQAQAMELGLSSCASLPGFMPDDELARTMRAADVLVMPSIMDASGDTEGLGVPLAEAMANDTAVVGSEIGGIKDIVQHEQSGLLYAPGDSAALAAALRRLQDEPALVQALVEGGKEQVAGSLSWGHLAQRTLAVFEDALRESRTAA